MDALSEQEKEDILIASGSSEDKLWGKAAGAMPAAGVAGENISGD